MRRQIYPWCGMMVLLLLSNYAWPQDRIESCHAIMWDYDYPEDELSVIALYASETSQNYGEVPLLPIPATQVHPLQVSCAEVASMLPHYGVWYLVARAWGPMGERSELSNEIIVQYGEVMTAPPPWTPPPVPTPPTPPPLPPRPPAPIIPRPTPPTPGTGWLTDAPAWHGTKTSPPRLGPPIVLPPVRSSTPGESLTDSCVWRGTCGK